MANTESSAPSKMNCPFKKPLSKSPPPRKSSLRISPMLEPQTSNYKIRGFTGKDLYSLP